MITLKENQLKKLCLSSIWNLETVCWHIDIRWKVFSPSKSECLTQPIQMELSNNLKVFFSFFLHFPNLVKILNTLDKKMTLRAYLSLKLYPAKIAVTWMTKTACIITLMDSQDVKRSEELLKPAQNYFCQIFWSLWKKISSKNSVFVGSEILRLFVNIFTPDENHSPSLKPCVWRNQFKCNYLEIEKYFQIFFLNFENLHKIFNTFEKKISLRGYWFLKH